VTGGEHEQFWVGVERRRRPLELDVDGLERP